MILERILPGCTENHRVVTESHGVVTENHRVITENHGVLYKNVFEKLHGEP